MTKRTNSNRTTNAARGGRITKTTQGTASVAQDSTEVAQEDTMAESLTAEPLEQISDEDLTPEVTPEPEAPVEAPTERDPHDEPITEPKPDMPAPPPSDKKADQEVVVAEGTEPEAEVAIVVADPFAALPLVKIEDYEFRDFSDAETVSNPRKYEGVHKEAIAGKLPVKKNWKHREAMVAVGRTHKEFRPGSVYGSIHQIVSSYGRAGVPAYVLVAKVRQAQIGNKRSHYCTALPPIGWAEGWIDTFVSKNYGRIMEKKAPALHTEEGQAAVTEALQAEASAVEKAAQAA